jgi:hypothetical protein
MTGLVNSMRVRQMRAPACGLGLVLRPMVPELRWTIDESSGRPVNCWMLAEKRPTLDLSPAASGRIVWGRFDRGRGMRA